ncbi:MAG: hypothetical protein ABW061_19470 [Polyangiaceae bacterium]
MTLRVLFWSAISCLSLAACVGPQQTKLYDLRDGSASVLVVASPTSSTGTLTGQLASGASCQGSFTRTNDGRAQE